jgi:hypothetical protein
MKTSLKVAIIVGVGIVLGLFLPALFTISPWLAIAFGVAISGGVLATVLFAD